MARIIASEGGSPDRLCVSCGMLGDWRCTDCLGHPIYCKTCCRSSHALNPFHRVQRWAGEYFEDSWLINTGLIIHFGHGGKPCPSINMPSLPTPTGTHEPDTATLFGLPNLVEEMEDPNDDLDLELSKLSQMEAAEAHELPDMNEAVDQELETHVREEWNPDLQKFGQNVLVIVHVNGVHHLPVEWCRCPGHLPEDIQALDLHCFPASFKRLRTLFTFHGLDAFLAENQECKSSAWHYYQKLRRLTSGSFPHLVPDRYRELLRCTRQYRNLKHLKWHGFGHDVRPPGLGDLAVQCPACPQPGINIPDDWDQKPNQWVAILQTLEF